MSRETTGARDASPAKGSKTAAAIEKALEGAVSVETAIPAEEIRRRMESAGANTPVTKVLRSHLSANRRERGWQRTNERPTKWYKPIGDSIGEVVAPPEVTPA